MKQTISIEQLNQLSPKAKQRLREWWKPKEGDKYCTRWGDVRFCGQLEDSTVPSRAVPDKIYFGDEWNGKAEDLPLLSIGQCIQFLDEHTAVSINSLSSLAFNRDLALIAYKREDIELIDALWSAVKEVLESEET